MESQADRAELCTPVGAWHKRQQQWWRWARLALLGGLVAGCGGVGGARQVAPDPELQATVSAYRAALSADDPAAAHRLLAPSLQKQLSLEQFRSKWKESKAERELQLAALSAPTRATSLRLNRAVVTLPQGTELLLAQNVAPSPPNSKQANPPGGAPLWQLVDPDLATVHAESPERLLELLIAAVEQRNYFAVLRLLSTSERQAIELELRERIERLRSSLTRRQSLPIEVHKDRARYQYDPRFFVDLVREDRGWRVLDLN